MTKKSQRRSRQDLSSTIICVFSLSLSEGERKRDKLLGSNDLRFVSCRTRWIRYLTRWGRIGSTRRLLRSLILSVMTSMYVTQNLPFQFWSIFFSSSLFPSIWNTAILFAILNTGSEGKKMQVFFLILEKIAHLGKLEPSY